MRSAAARWARAYLNSYSNAQVKNSLTADATSTDDAMAVASLPATGPVSGTFWEARAEAKAAGLLGASASIDGYVGFRGGNRHRRISSDIDGHRLLALRRTL